jgi:hypothetical protein
MVVLAVPKNYTTGRVSFKYGVSGERYPFYEAYFLGPDGMTWLIVAISVAGVMAFLIFIVLLLCLIKCIRSCCCKQKVAPEGLHNNKSLSDQPLNKTR